MIITLVVCGTLLLLVAVGVVVGQDPAVRAHKRALKTAMSTRGIPAEARQAAVDYLAANPLPPKDTK